ncbi:MAG: acyltransferase [Oscillospiraceae bacterium]
MKAINDTACKLQHFKEIDFLKGIAITLVILGHSIVSTPINLHNTHWCDMVSLWCGSAQMPLFFLVSGFCFSYRGDYKAFALKKAKRLLIPCLFFNLIDMIPRAALSELMGKPSGIHESIRSTIFAGGSYWFLHTLMVIFLIFPCISFVYQKYKIAKFLFLPILIIINLYNFSSISIFRDILCIKSVGGYLVYFYIGYICKQNFSILKKVKQLMLQHKVSIIGLDVIILIAWFLLCQVKFSSILLGVSIRMVNSFLGILFFTIAVSILELPHISKAFIEFGKYSLQLYLLNRFYIFACKTISFSVFGITSPLLIIVINMSAALVLSYFSIKYIFNRFKLFRVVSGAN